MHRLPGLLMDLSRASHDVDAVLQLGARGAATLTGSAAVILVGTAGSLRMGPVHDEVLARRAMVGRALERLLPESDPSPFTGPLDTGQNALLDVPALAFSPARPPWAAELERLGIASLGLTPLLAGDHTVGLLMTCRTAGDEPLTTSVLADQGQIATHVAAFLDTAMALGQMRDSSLIVDAMPDAVVAFSRDREVILWSAGAERMYGITEEDALGQPLDSLVTTDPRTESESGRARPAISLINQGSWTGRVQQRTRDGRVLQAEVSIASIIQGGLLRGAVSIHRDVSALVEAERRQAEHARRVQALLDASLSPTAVVDADGTVVAVNSAWQSAMEDGGGEPGTAGVGADYLGAMRAAARTSTDAAAVLAGMESVLAGRSPSFEWDYDLQAPDGTTTAHMVAIAPMPGPDGGAFATHTDISARKATERALAHEAAHDALTGLRTRRRMEHDLTAALADSEVTGLPVGVVLADLDRFTDVNDTLGHEVGDQVLIEMAARLRSVPGATSIGRLAGDEFAVAIPGVRDRVQLARAAEGVARLMSAPMPVEGRELFFGVSLGTALSSDLGDGPDAAANLLRAADTAMYRAKSRGRNSVVAYDEGLRTDVERRLQVSSWLNRALERHEMSLAYQPQFRCLDGKQCGVEARLRWHHPEAGTVPAREFVPIAEESGAIIPIGAWAIAEACHSAAAWAARAGADFSVAVSISAHQLVDPGLADVVRGALLGSRLPASCLTLDVGEGALVEQTEKATEALARLRAMGVRIALDDFGAGYSSLAYLSRFPVDELRMDRMFVRDIERDPRTRALAGGIIRIGHALGMRVVADGVQAPGQLRILSGMGADCYQGPLAADPEDADEIAHRLVERLTRGDVPDEIALTAGRPIGWR